jgi:hypothetical protein
MKLLIKEIIEKIQEFDKANHEFRFKSYDVYDHKGEIFVEYVTQCDYNRRLPRKCLDTRGRVRIFTV